MQSGAAAAGRVSAVSVADERLFLTIDVRAELLPTDHRTGSGVASRAYDD
jgi:hypothetical protein